MDSSELEMIRTRREELRRQREGLEKSEKILDDDIKALDSLLDINKCEKATHNVEHKGISRVESAEKSEQIK